MLLSVCLPPKRVAWLAMHALPRRRGSRRKGRQVPKRSRRNAEAWREELLEIPNRLDAHSCRWCTEVARNRILHAPDKLQPAGATQGAPAAAAPMAAREQRQERSENGQIQKKRSGIESSVTARPAKIGKPPSASRMPGKRWRYEQRPGLARPLRGVQTIIRTRLISPRNGSTCSAPSHTHRSRPRPPGTVRATPRIRADA